MKRILNVVSIAAGILAIVLLSSTLGRPSRTASSLQSQAPAFAGFPVDQSRTIELSAADEAMKQLTRREYADQVRDWLLTTIVSDAGLSPAELNQSLFDLPPVRYGYIRPVGAFEYGATRSRSIGNGRLIALIPKSNPAQRLDDLAQLADDARKNTGDKPTTVLVFEYELVSNLSAEITRRANVQGDALFTPESGYIETAIRNLDSLRDFMGGIDDLTFARVDSGVLWLGGRKLRSHHHHNITVDDAAALWSAQTKLRTKNDQFERFLAQKKRDFNDRWSHKQYHYDSERIRLEAQRDAELAAVKEEIDRERETLGVVAHTGFSLDPSFVYAKVKATMEGPDFQKLMVLSQGRISRSEIADAAEAAGNGKMDAVYTLLQKLDPEVGRSVVLYLKATCGYQSARYDGALGGTEVGMVLFYTDLLAKLWALDFMSSAPDAAIDDFHSMSHMVVSAIYQKEMEVLPSTRLWFGVQSKGFSMKNSGGLSLLLAPVATRLYAASSDSLEPGKEVARNAASAAFLGWWDDHYAEVARFEPEYERLNEIMKWSIVISWLDKKGQLERLAPLAAIGFRRDNWFPDWVRQHSDLRFQNWDRIQFFPRGYAKTESLPLLHSDRGVPHPLMGGVSLAEPEIFETRGAISEGLAETARRPTLDWSESTPDLLRTVDGAEYKLGATTEDYTVDASLKAGAKFRSLDTEVANLQYSRSLAFDNAGMRMEVRNSGTAVGELQIERAENGFRVAWQSRDLDMATSLARQLGSADDPAAALASDARVAAFARTGEHDFLVRLDGSTKWLKIGTGRTEGPELADGWQSRVAPLDPHAKSVDLAFVSDDKAASELGPGGLVRVSRASAQSDGVRLDLGARPPPGAANTSVHIEGHAFTAQRDGATGDYYLRWLDLPDDIRAHPELLRGIGASPVQEASLGIDEIAAGRFRLAADELARAPGAFKAALDQHYVAGLKNVDVLLEQGDEGHALQLLDQMARIHGNTPEIAVRKALVLTRTNPGMAARALNEGMKIPIRDGRPLFNEINARLAHASGDEQQNLYQLASFSDWNNLRYAGAYREGIPIAVVDKGKLQIDYHAVAGLKATRIPDLPPGDAPIYVQDSPGLSNLDSPAAIQQALHNGVQGRIPQVLRMTQEDIAMFRPAKIYLPDRQISLRQVDTSSGSSARVASRAYRAYSNSPCSPGDPRAECADARQPVYLVMDPQQAAKLN